MIAFSRGVSVTLHFGDGSTLAALPIFVEKQGQAMPTGNLLADDGRLVRLVDETHEMFVLDETGEVLTLAPRSSLIRRGLE